jgi:uncharacterized membrane protein YhaH (DUF805 family)
MKVRKNSKLIHVFVLNAFSVNDRVPRKTFWVAKRIVIMLQLLAKGVQAFQSSLLQISGC